MNTVRRAVSIFAIFSVLAPATAQSGPLVSQGPVGGGGGSPFQEVVPYGGRIVQVFGRSLDSGIEGFGFAWEDENGKRTLSSYRGRSTGTYWQFDIPQGDCLSEVCVRRDDRLVRQLTFRTVSGLSKTVGSGGKETVCLGMSTETQAGEVVGFHGASGWLVDRLGVYLRWTNRTRPPKGGNGGRPFAIAAPPGGRIEQVYGHAHYFLHAIGIVYRDRSNRRIDTGIRGATGGLRFWFDIPPGDFLTGVTVWEDGLVRGLSLRTGAGIEKDVGLKVGRRHDMSGGEITGFLGRSGSLVDRLGVTSRPHGSPGPYGGYGGGAFDMRLPTSYRIVKVYGRSGSLVDGIGFLYEDSYGRQHNAGYRGGYGGQYWSFSIPADDYLELVQVRTSNLVHQVILRTKKGLRGVFGGNGGTLQPPMYRSGYEIDGLFGSSGRFLDRLGARMRVRIRSIGEPCMGAARASLYMNGAPRIGQKLTVLGAYPPADSLGGLYFSRAPQRPLRFARNCYIWVDATNYSFAGWVQQNPSFPVWSMDFRLPNNTALVGVPLAFQAAFSAPTGVEFTNGYQVMPLR